MVHSQRRKYSCYTVVCYPQKMWISCICKYHWSVFRWINSKGFGTDETTSHFQTPKFIHFSYASWASYHIRKLAGRACAGNAGNVFPITACVARVLWCMSGSLTSRFLWSRMRNPRGCLSGKGPNGATVPEKLNYLSIHDLRYIYLNEWLGSVIWSIF